ncbi:MAG: hypothetical protein R3Y56_04315 [Akkermansia sp.]
MKKTKVVIIGGKGTAVVIAEQIDDARTRFGMDIEVLGFAFDDEAYKDGINGWPVLCGTREAYAKYKDDPSVFFVFALYRADILAERIALRDSLGIPKERHLSFIHPSAYVAKSAVLGHGNIVLVNCVINNNTVIGDYNTFNSATLVGHDTSMGDNNFSAAHVCIGSRLKIANGNFFGLNCSVRNAVVMGDYNLIAMGANAVKNLGDHTLAIGNPAVNKARS